MRIFRRLSNVALLDPRISPSSPEQKKVSKHCDPTARGPRLRVGEKVVWQSAHRIFSSENWWYGLLPRFGTAFTHSNLLMADNHNSPEVAPNKRKPKRPKDRSREAADSKQATIDSKYVTL